MNIDIAGITLAIHSSCSETKDFYIKHYKDFLSEDKPDFKLEVSYQDKQDPSSILGVDKKDLDHFINPQLREKTRDEHIIGRPDIFEYPDKMLAVRHDFAGIIQLKKKEGKLIVKKDDEKKALDSFLRVCFATLITENHGLMLHSAGIMKDDAGYIFFGVSRTGKTTIANLSRDFTTILSDEFITIKKEKDKYIVYGSPFYGNAFRHGVNQHCGLKAAFLPVKDTDNSIKRAHPVTFLAKFLSATVVFSKKPETVNRVLDIAHDFIETVPFYELHFQKNTGFWKCIDKLNQHNYID